MLSNGERVALPYETNNTRWTFHRRGDLDYLTQITRGWPENNVSLSSFYFKDYADINIYLSAKFRHHFDEKKRRRLLVMETLYDTENTN